MKNLKYYKTVSETEIGQIELPESQIGLSAGTGFSVRVRTDSRSENPDPILNNISNHNSKTHTGGKLNNTVEKIWDTHLGTYPVYKVIQIFSQKFVFLLLH